MRGIGRIAVLGLVLLAACSGGGGGSAASTSTTTSTSTTLATTTTLSQEQAVKAAWDGYWAMVVRLGAKPDGNDPELAQRATDPLLSALRDDYGTRAAKGTYVVIPNGARYSHRLDKVELTSSNSATTNGCKIDDSVSMGPSGVIDDSVSSADITVTFVLYDTWKATSVKFANESPGIVGCAER